MKSENIIKLWGFATGCSRQRNFTLSMLCMKYTWWWSLDDYSNISQHLSGFKMELTSSWKKTVYTCCLRVNLFLNRVQQFVWCVMTQRCSYVGTGDRSSSIDEWPGRSPWLQVTSVNRTHVTFSPFRGCPSDLYGPVSESVTTFLSSPHQGQLITTYL
jgi:hypothetical protein